MPGEQALAANRAIIARGAKADEAIDRALTARGIPKAGPAELNAAQTAVADASREWGTVRGRWLAEQTRGGADLDDLLRLLQAGSSNLDNIPAALAWIPDEVWTARRAVDTAQDALSAVYANRRAYATAWQEEARRYLYASRGEGRAFTVGTVDDAGRAIWDRAAASYPAPWADRWDATVGTAQVRWGTGRGWNRTNRTSSGRVSVEIQTGTARGDGLATTIHEIGHTFETTVPGLSSAEWTFLRYRATGPRGGLDQPRVIPGYRRTETYYRDAKMPAPYTAKVYGELPSSHFELFTTGAEGVLGPVSSYLDFIAEDLEFRRWILGMLDNL